MDTLVTSWNQIGWLSIDKVVEQFDATREQVTAVLDFVGQTLPADAVLPVV